MPTTSFKIFGQINYPNVNRCFNWRSTKPTVSCPLPGLLVEAVDIIAKRLNLTTKFIQLGGRGAEFGSSANATEAVETAFGFVKNGTYDLMAAFFDKNINFHGEGLEASLAIYDTTAKYVVAPAQSLTGIFSFFTIYDSYSWLGIFGTFVLFLIIGLIIYGCAPRMATRERRGVGELTWYFVRSELLQSESVREKLISFNALTLFFALFNCGILIQMYNSLITTQAVRPVDPRPFKENDILQVLKEGKYSFIFPDKFSSHYRDIMNSSRSPYFELREALENNPIQLVHKMNPNEKNRIKYMMDRVERGGWVTVQSTEQIDLDRQQGYCNFVYMETDFLPKTKHLLLRKNHPLLHQINRIIKEEEITLRQLYKKYFKYPKPSKCEEVKKGPKALALMPYIGIMILLAVGFSAATIAFFVELWMDRKLK